MLSIVNPITFIRRFKMKKMRRSDRMDKRLVLIHRSGDKFYPFKKLFRRNGKFGFPITPKGCKERNGDALYLQSLEEVLPLFFYEGYSLSASTDHNHGLTADKVSAYTIQGEAIVAYEISHELLHLVEKATIPPRRVF